MVIRPGAETTEVETAFFPLTRATALRMSGQASATAKPQNAGSREPHNDSAGQAASVAREGQTMKQFLQQAGVDFETVAGASLAYDGSALIVTQTTRNLERIRNILVRYREVQHLKPDCIICRDTATRQGGP